uniref:EF-hand domain-containing protein n=1 Tax=Percolomonas cosmopolitus TaxID=63605 RepID=A0A7S1KUV2_9EUKA
MTSISPPNAPKGLTKEYSLRANTFTQEDIEKIRAAFDKYDSQLSGTVNLFKLIFIFNELGQTVTEPELLELLDDSAHSRNPLDTSQNLMSETESLQQSARRSDSPGTPHEGHGAYGNSARNVQQQQTQNVDYSRYEIPFHTFLKILETHRERRELRNNEQDLLDSFVSMGGNPNGTGYIKSKKIKEICDEFGLTVDVNELLKVMDENHMGKVRFPSFKKALTTDLKLDL